MHRLTEQMKSAALKAAEKYEENRHDSYDSYLYRYKTEVLEEAVKMLEASSPEKALEKMRADLAEYTALRIEEEQHPTFDWAGDHVWDMIYSGREEGAKEAVALLEEYLGKNNEK